MLDYVTTIIQQSKRDINKYIKLKHFVDEVSSSSECIFNKLNSDSIWNEIETYPAIYSDKRCKVVVELETQQDQPYLRWHSNRAIQSNKLQDTK